MSSQTPSDRRVIRWTTLRGSLALILFLVLTVLAEYLVVVYAVSLGVQDQTLLQWSFKFPGTDWTVTLAISPLFHMVPVSVIIVLLTSWIYLTRRLTISPSAPQKTTPTSGAKRGVLQRIDRSLRRIGNRISETRGISYLAKRFHSARAPIRGALTVLIVFVIFIFLFSLFTYPQLIFLTIANAYQNNPSLLNFVKGVGQALAPIGSVFAGVNNALLGSAGGFRDFATGLGRALTPLANLDPAGKYLVFQNMAAWVSAIIVLLYGEFGRKVYRYRKK